MPLVGVSNKPSKILANATPLGSILQNSGNSNVYISDSPNVTADSSSIILYPGTPFEWPAFSELWAICGASDISSITYFPNGAHIGVSVTALQTAINTLISVTQSSANPQPTYYNAAAANTVYKVTTTLTSGVYTIGCPVGVITNVDFYDVNGVYIGTATTASGTIDYNLGTLAGSFAYWTNTGTNNQISITKKGSAVTSVSGTLYTFTSSQTINFTGDAYIVLIGGGQAGQDGLAGARSGAGGKSANVLVTRAYLTGACTLTIGQASVRGSSPALGGDTTIIGTGVSLSSATAANAVAGGAAVARDGANHPGLPGTALTVPDTIFPFLPQGSIASGGSGAEALGNSSQTGGANAGSGIGVSGVGGNTVAGTPTTATVGGNATGFGSGGGGGADASGTPVASNGGNATNGVCYIVI